MKKDKRPMRVIVTGDVGFRDYDLLEKYCDRLLPPCDNCGSAIFYSSGTMSDEDLMNHYRYCHHCGRLIRWTTIYTLQVGGVL